MILVCGEALIDLFLYDREDLRLSAEAVAGGSPFNVAIGLSRLGCPSAFCGGLSTDSFGNFLADILSGEGVNLDYALRTPRLSTISVVATDPMGRPRYSFHGENAADRSLTIADLKPEIPADIGALTFGSYTLGVEPVASAYLALARRESGKRLISIDPNIRPTVIGSLTGYDQQLFQFFRTASLIKASEEDIELLYGSAAPIGDVVRAWQTLGPKLVIVTRGASGAVAFFRGQTIDVPGRRVEVVDTVGAGDSFHAAFLAFLDRENRLQPDTLETLSPDSLARALQYAVMAASITCGRRGALLPRRAEVDPLFLATSDTDHARA
jgi:fructokinase